MTDLCVDQSYMKLRCLYLVPADSGLTLTYPGLSLDTMDLCQHAASTAERACRITMHVLFPSFQSPPASTMYR